ncbi:hypothetical protein Acr_00g0099600 [Actinidia rufa]|uniref:Transmembrane protein n=1 Tax=Actinidia rufa TaxID=165716 RepID=A0A7J0DZJ9_9ERIC|nr:hypothetical protein Acr_00g0099600 [Actinidia rufa]
MASVTTISILLNSLLFFTTNFFTKLKVRDLITKLSSLLSNSSAICELIKNIIEEIRVIIRIELAFVPCSFVVLLFSVASVVLASAGACYGETLSFRDFEVGKVVFENTSNGVPPKTFCYRFRLPFLGYIDISSHPLALIPIIVFSRQFSGSTYQWFGDWP